MRDSVHSSTRFAALPRHRLLVLCVLPFVNKRSATRAIPPPLHPALPHHLLLFPPSPSSTPSLFSSSSLSPCALPLLSNHVATTDELEHGVTWNELAKIWALAALAVDETVILLTLSLHHY